MLPPYRGFVWVKYIYTENKKIFMRGVVDVILTNNSSCELTFGLFLHHSMIMLLTGQFLVQTNNETKIAEMKNATMMYDFDNRTIFIIRWTSNTIKYMAKCMYESLRMSCFNMWLSIRNLISILSWHILSIIYCTDMENTTNIFRPGVYNVMDQNKACCLCVCIEKIHITLTWTDYGTRNDLSFLHA